MNARLELRFEAAERKTALRVAAQQPPWRVVRGFPDARGGVLVHLHNVSGGILAGDQLTLDIDVGAGAKAQVTSTGATRLYRHRPGSEDSRQVITIRIDTGGLLEYLPDALIPYRGSRHNQRTAVMLANGATFFWWEILAPGRQAMGETFAFERLSVQTEIRTGRGPALLENFVLEPGVRPLTSLARMGRFTHMATLVAFQVGRPQSDLRQLESELNGMAASESVRTGDYWGAGALASDGVMVRGLSESSLELPGGLTRFWSAARQFLTGEPAVLPRKLK